MVCQAVWERKHYTLITHFSLARQIKLCLILFPCCKGMEFVSMQEEETIPKLGNRHLSDATDKTNIRPHCIASRGGSKILSGGSWAGSVGVVSIPGHLDWESVIRYY